MLQIQKILALLWQTKIKERKAYHYLQLSGLLELKEFFKIESTLNKQKKLEKKIEQKLKLKKVFITGSGNHAFELALKLLALKKTDEIILPVFTCKKLGQIIEKYCKPVFVDVTKNITVNPKEIQKKINKNTKAVIAIHLYGQACEIQKIKEICAKNKIILIEDCAHSLGLKIKNKNAGNFGDLSIFSFRKSTNLANGGFICINNAKFENKIKKLNENKSNFDLIKNLFGLKVLICKIIFGNSIKMPFLVYSSLGFKGNLINDKKLSRIELSIALIEIEKIKNQIQKRITCAKYLKNKLKEKILWTEKSNSSLMRLPVLLKESSQKNWNLFYEQGFEVGSWYYTDFLVNCKNKQKNFPVASKLANKIMPIGLDGLKKSDLNELIELIKKN